MATESKFKEGDYIRMVEDDLFHGYGIGDVFKLTRVRSRGVTFTDNDGDSRHADNDSGRFDPWTPKVGERVRRAKGYNIGSDIGHIATVMEVEDISAYDSNGPWLKFTDGTSGYATSFEPLPVAAEAQPAAPLQIVAGRYYKTRDGRKVGPMKMSDRHDWPFIGGAEGECDDAWYRSDGSCPYIPSDDLIDEWPADTTTTNVAATVDALNEEYGPVVRDFTNIAVNVTNIDDLDAVIAKLKKIRKLQRELGLIAARTRPYRRLTTNQLTTTTLLRKQ